MRRSDLDHPDELRIDLDPQPGVEWSEVREVALCAGDVLREHGMLGFPKTSGSRGIHVNVRIEPRWSFTEVRRAALALAREVERRMPGRATTAWWKEERIGVFLDYNQNARDRTVASQYSVRAVPDAKVSCPLRWDEVADVEPEDLRLDTVPARLREVGDVSATIDDVHHSLDALLDLARRDEEEGLGDAPWPPHFAKQAGEPKRVQPSRARGEGARRSRARPATVRHRARRAELVHEAVARLVVAAVLAEEAAVRAGELLVAVGAQRLDLLVARAPAALVLEPAVEARVAREALGQAADLGAEALGGGAEGGVEQPDLDAPRACRPR